jgi:hypothetical protein
MWKSEPTGYGHVEMAIKQALPPCQIKCPINEDIQRTNVLISLLPPDSEAKARAIICLTETPSSASADIYAVFVNWSAITKTRAEPSGGDCSNGFWLTTILTI